MFTAPKGGGLGDVDLGRSCAGVKNGFLVSCMPACWLSPVQSGLSGSFTGTTGVDAGDDWVFELSDARENEVVAAAGDTEGCGLMLLEFASSAELAKKFGTPLDAVDGPAEVELEEVAGVVDGGAAKNELDTAAASFAVACCSGVGGTTASLGGWGTSFICSVVAVLTGSGVLKNEGTTGALSLSVAFGFSIENKLADGFVDSVKLVNENGNEVIGGSFAPA